MKTSKIRIENTQDFKGETIRVFKSDFEIYQHIDNYYSIRLSNSPFGSNVVFGGDAGWDDCYDKQVINSIFQQWDGTLKYQGEKYGYRIEM